MALPPCRGGFRMPLEDGRGSGSNEIPEEERPCVECVSDALARRAESVSRAELRRAGPRFKELNRDGESIIREMVKRLAMRIVRSPIRQLRETTLRDHTRTAARVRWIFGIEEPDGCPLVASTFAEAIPPPNDPPARCPHRSDPENT
jgi:hypothetical protein